MPSQHLLFRQEAIEFQQHNRQWGQVALLQSLSTKIIAWFIVAAVAIIVIFLFLAQYSRKETVTGYLMPTAGDVPSVEVMICEDAPSPLNPMGLKGAGEGGANAAGAAIAAAIDDALGGTNAVTELPVTPQRLRRLIRRAVKQYQTAQTTRVAGPTS